MNEIKAAQSVAGTSLVHQLLNREPSPTGFSAKERSSGISFEKTSYNLNGKDSLSVSDFRSFAAKNQDLLYAISKSDAAKEALKKAKVSSREDLVKIVAQAAYDTVKVSGGVDEESLKQSFEDNPSLAALVLSNVGGIQEIVKKQENAKEVFLEGNAESGVFKQLAQKAADLFGEGHRLNDAQFFENNVSAAIYVLNNPTLVSQFKAGESGDTASKQFRENVKNVDRVAVYDSVAASLAHQSVNRASFSESFFQDNLEFSQFVAAGDILNFSNKPSEILQKNISYQLNNLALGDRFNSDDVINQALAEDAFSKLGKNSAINVEFLSQHSGFAQFIRENDEYKAALNSGDNQKALQIVFGQQEAPSKDLKDVLQSLEKNYSSGRRVSLLT